MLRNLQEVSGKNVDATYTARVTMKRGMFVQKDTDGTAKLPTSATNLYFVSKGNFPIGTMCAEGELSDYDSRYETIASGDPIILEKPISGEVYGTDQYIATSLVNGCYVTVSTVADATQGKVIYSADPTSYVYRGTVVDNGHTLAKIEVV